MTKYFKINTCYLITLLFYLIPSPLSAKKLWLGMVFKTQTEVSPNIGLAKGEIALLVEKIIPGSGAMEGGIKQGDYIIGTEKGHLKNLDYIKSRLDNSKVGDKLKLQIYSANKIKWIDLPLYERPSDLSQWTGSAIGSKKPYKGEIYANEKAFLKKPKAILLDFWATWCGPCRITSKLLEKLHHQYHAQGLEIVGLSDEPKLKLEQFYKEHPVSYGLSQDKSGRISRSYGVKRIPTLFLLDQEGYILQVFFGVPDEAELSKEIERLLN